MDISKYENLIKDLQKLEVNPFPSNYNFIRYYPPLNELPRMNGVLFSGHKANFPKLSGKLALFVYIPFCTGRCSYCFYVKNVTMNNSKSNEMVGFLKVLTQEMSVYRKIIKDYPISSVYIGGGTPSILSSAFIEILLKEIKGKFNLSNLNSFTFEASPETLDIFKIDALKKHGVKRISLGVQSLNDKILRSIFRRHFADDVVNVVQLLKDNIPNFNLDFIYGLKNQKECDIRKILRFIKEFLPPSVTFYEKWTAMKDSFKDKSLKSKQDIKSVLKIIETRELIKNTMQELGYFQDGLFRFVKKEENACLYCKTVWEDNSCLALGPSAYSYINGLEFQNARSAAAYEYFLRNGYFPISRKKVLTPQEMATRAFILGLKTNGISGCGIDLSIISEKYKVELKSEVQKLLDNFVSIGAIINEDGKIFFSEEGENFAEQILLRILKEKIIFEKGEENDI